MKTAIAILSTLIGLLIIVIIFVNTGWYNISAMNVENGIFKWIFTTTKENSIDFRTGDIKVPNLNDSSLIEMGFAHYKEMCESCHGAPGKEETELAKGLNPPAPRLVKIAKYLSPQEIFWATKNGIKMTGMPAWGKTHPDVKIWAIVSAVKKLPGLTAAEYDSLGNEMKMK
jgi:mono/diheme cytochrome c family protein